jgi:hypothetical protein
VRAAEQDDRIAKYDKWYKTLKAGAKAKQLSQSRERSGASSFNSSSSFVQNGGSSFHDYSAGAGESAGDSSSASRQSSRPPAHPNRRAL